VVIYLPADATRFAGGTVVEARCVGPIIDGICEAGLLVYVDLRAEVQH
jgi:hypothetical protein